MPPPGSNGGGNARAPDLNALQRLRAAHDAAVHALQAAVRDTTRLTRLFTILSEPAPLNALLDRVLSTLSELFFSDIVALLEPAEAGTFSLLRAIGIPEDRIHEPMSGAEESYLAAAIEARAPVVAADAREDPRVDLHLRELDVRTVAWLPVVGNDGVTGVMVMARCRPIPYASSDLDLLMAMAYRIGLVLERTRAEALLREAQERLLQTEKLALAGNLAGSVAHEVNNPLACVRSNLETLQRHVPTIAATLRAARRAAQYLADQPAAAAQMQAREILAAMDGGDGAGDIAGELAEIVTDSLDGATRIGRLVTSFMRLAAIERAAEPERLDVRAIIAESIADLPPDTGRPALVQEAVDDGTPCIAWIARSVLTASLTGLLRPLLAPDLPRAESARPITVRAECRGGQPAVIIADPAILLSDEQRRRIFDLRMEEVETPKGRTMTLSLMTTLSYHLLRGCGAEISTTAEEGQGLTIRIVLPTAPGETAGR